MYHKHYEVLKRLEELLNILSNKGENFITTNTLVRNVSIAFDAQDKGISLYTTLNIETLYHISTRKSKIDLCYGDNQQVSAANLNLGDSFEFFGLDSIQTIPLFPVNIDTGEGSDKLFQMSTIYDNIIIDEVAILSHYKYNNPNGINILAFANHKFNIDEIIYELDKFKESYV